ncbi:integrating conjugative element protein [Burkholderia pyrrocinia]|uniref:integrating conjugative element protein n=1 Tax=Burkholderia pyrrocinia TaxID=60550 RepID=UPI001FB2FB1D|nr:integrating conjugative element protein [Burkholderia pyrrocinia]UOB57160.1 integrating conjugative element protein [Burkholderia pyrrocinia]
MHAFVAIGLAAGLPPVTAQTATPLIVVEDRGSTSALPYYEALAPQPEATPTPSGNVTMPQRASDADMLPVRSTRLTPGVEPHRTIEAPGLQPLFLIGDDARSRAWLKQRLPALRKLNAVGLIVNVEHAAALQVLRGLAPDLQLSPVSGDDLAQRLGLRHYPVLITSTGVEP